MNAVKITLGIVGVLVVASMLYSEPEPEPVEIEQAAEPEPEPEPEPSPSETRSGPHPNAVKSCNYYADVMDDVAAGVLTDPELRAELKEVRELANRSGVNALFGAATGMVAAMTDRDFELFEKAMAAFEDSCGALGVF